MLNDRHVRLLISCSDHADMFTSFKIIDVERKGNLLLHITIFNTVAHAGDSKPDMEPMRGNPLHMPTNKCSSLTHDLCKNVAESKRVQIGSYAVIWCFEHLPTDTLEFWSCIQVEGIGSADGSAPSHVFKTRPSDWGVPEGLNNLIRALQYLQMACAMSVHRIASALLANQPSTSSLEQMCTCPITLVSYLSCLRLH